MASSPGTPSSSLTRAMRRRIRGTFPDLSNDTSASNNSSSSSWSTINDLPYTGTGPDRPPLAWAGVRHQVTDDERVVGTTSFAERSAGYCNQVVLLTCLHLSHEIALREVGLYAWMVPSVRDPQGAMMMIMTNYTQQMTGLTTRSDLLCRSAPDPSRDVVRHHLLKARRAAGLERYVAVIYSGHGIQEPPTEAGELWCYDRSFEECAQTGGAPSEYIPVILFDFLTWAGSSTCYVWDCQHAARILRAAIVEAEEIDTQLRAAIAQNASVADLHPAVYTRKQIHFAACGADETLPRVPGMPDDLFTACLTTPLRIALLFHNLETFPFTRSLADVQVQRSSDYMAELWDLMSHDLKTRLWCELQAILLTIAWQALDGREYQALFGQNGDVVSSLATGFLLSQRVMPAYHAHPESIPAILMPTNHPLWKHWDLILDNFFEQLPDYTAEGSLDPTWEAQLQLVSFMADQLNSILTTDLSRLPIICRAALTRSHREPACVALDACLADLDIHGLDRAVQAGALDVAAELLALGDENVSPRMISIWASLVRHDECVMNLAKDGLQAERLTSVPAVEFFIRHLEENIDEQISGDKGVVVQSAAVLSTIAKFVAGRQATRLVTRSLRSAAAMLSSRDELVQQWGALLIAEVKGSIVDVDAEEDELIESLKLQLLGLGESDIVETRVSAVYALARWISASPIRDIVSLGPMLDLTHQLATQARNDGSAVVRKELARLFHRVLLRGGVWTTFTIWVYILQSAIRDIPSEKARCLTLMAEAGKKTGLTADQQSQMFRLTELIRLLGTLRQDPDRRVATLVSDSLSTLTADLQMHVQEKAWDAVFKIGFPSGPAEEGWTLESLASLKTAGLAFLADWDRRMAAEPGRVGDMPSQELFEKSKLSLQAYLARGSASQPRPEQDAGQSQDSAEWKRLLRQRLLEDSIVLAEQQVGLPWRWEMKDIESPDPWSRITCHSFSNTMLSCNGSQDMLLWDWSTSRKTGAVHLDLPAGVYATYARFVNELHEQTVVMAEISNGNVHVLAGPADEPKHMKTISTFVALDMHRFAVPVADDDYRRLISTWWRQSGMLCVGGAASVINVWDCPTERCTRVVETDSHTSCSTLITEPVSGNIIIGGFRDGKVKLYDLRHNHILPVLTWQGDASPGGQVASGRAIAKAGVVYGESTQVTSACANGLINIHDIRHLNEPAASLLVHPSGISSASFQAHSGLMSTVSVLNPALTPSSTATPTDPGRPRANWSIHRSAVSRPTLVTEETTTFSPQSEDVGQRGFKPYTSVHPLRPFLAVGYGRTCFLRGSGVGKGEDTDSGSYSFLKAQAKFVM